MTNFQLAVMLLNALCAGGSLAAAASRWSEGVSAKAPLMLAGLNIFAVIFTFPTNL